ncbi:MAG: NAD(+)/NADH kinase [Bacilli bacterium]|nr:NAD(+)/NADH kinase [Bacilli bacterium]
MKKMKDIKKVKLFVNHNVKSRQVEKETREALLEKEFEITESNDFDLGIAIGGDGSFLRMVNDSGFKKDAFYVGINAGTLGFAQDIPVEEVKEFIEHLKNREFYYEEIGIQDVEVESKEGISHFQCLNEIVFREEELNTAHMDVYIDGVLLENFVGDGLLVSTSFGSTAYNLSYGGSIVYNEFDTLQLTPIAPMSNKTYRSLTNSLVMPSTKTITLIPEPESSNMIVMVDGRNSFYTEVKQIRIGIQEHILLIRKKDYNYIRKINDKFIK